MKPTINIHFDFIPGPYGGGNQFIKALRNYFIDRNMYEEDVSKASIILFNSDHSLRRVLKSKLKYNDKIFIHRLAGPMYIPRGSGKEADNLVYKMNHYIADGTIFQSTWSRNENYRAGLKSNRHETIIINAPDHKIFNKKARDNNLKSDKTRLIATSWSSNMGKGFDIYKYIDENLDYNRFSFTFVGRSPYNFKNIVHIPPQTTNELANILSSHDIFISASRYEACSNSVIEAMHCGLPAIVFNDSSNPEIIGKGGVTFNSVEDIIAAIQKVADNYQYYKQNVDLPIIDEVGEKYLNFCIKILDEYNNGRYDPKRINHVQYYLLSIALPDFILKRMMIIVKSLLFSIYNIGKRK
jgi:glycosyltransferase involved in cell wall biosynthesis